MPKSKNSLFILIAILAIGGVLIYSSGAFQGASSTIGSGSTGFTLTSISLLDESGRAVIVSKDSDLSALNWVINLSANGGGQSLTGTISKDQIFDGTNKANNPLSITLDAVDETVEYKVSGQPINVYEYYLTTGRNLECESTHLLYQFKQLDSFWGIPTGGYTTYCVRRDVVANAYNIDTPTVKNQAIMTLKIGNTSITQTVGNLTQGARFESNGVLYATAISNGYLVTGNSPPSAANFRAMYNIDLPQYPNKWHSVRAETLAPYLSQEQILLSNLLTLKNQTGGILDSGWVVSSQLPSTAGTCKSNGGVNCENMFNTMFSLANQNGRIAGSEDYSFVQTLGEQFVGSASGAVLAHKFDASILHQSITLYVKADKLGIVFPESKGEIVSLTCPDFVSNFRGSIQATIKNTGSEVAPFELRLGTCGFSLEYVLSKPTIAAGQVSTQNIYLHNLTVASQFSSVCTVDLYDTFGKKLDSENVTCNQLPPSGCIVNDTKAQGNCLLKCVSGNWTQEKCCAANEELTFAAGIWSCLEKTGAGQTGTGGTDGTTPPISPTCAWYEVSKETQTCTAGALPCIGASLLNWGFNIKIGVIQECVVNPLLIVGVFAAIIIAIVVILMLPKKGRGRIGLRRRK